MVCHQELLNKTRTYTYGFVLSEKFLLLTDRYYTKVSNHHFFSLLPGEKPFKCDICNRSFVQNAILKRHYLIHTGEKPFVCGHSGCKERFRQREQLKSHINRCHTENPVFELHKCSFCPKSFCHASGLSRHLLSHAGKTFDCQICLKSYSDKSTLRRHMINIHDEHTNQKKADPELNYTYSLADDHDPEMYTIEQKPNIL